MEQANILVIEDDDIVSRTIERCLRRENYKVAIANSGVEGLQVAHKRVPDLVILDVIMPGMDGYTVCREMRADPILVNVPILFLTAPPHLLSLSVFYSAVLSLNSAGLKRGFI